MNLKKLVILSAALFIVFAAFAQQRLVEDVVYLKNGSVIRGLIVEEVPAVSLKIMTADRSVFVFKLDEIERIEHVYDFRPVHPHRLGLGIEGGLGSSGADSGPEPLSAWAMGVEYSYAGSLRNNEVSNIHGLYGLIGYHVNPQVTTSLGFGVEDLQYINWIPLFADFNLKVRPAQSSPYFYGRMGINIPTAQEEYYNDYDAGMLAGMGFGFRLPLSPAINFNASIGYRYQYVGYRSYVYPEPYPYPKPLPGIETGGGEVNTGTDPGNQSGTIEPPYPYPDPNTWPPIYWEPVKIKSHGHYITFTFGVSF